MNERLIQKIKKQISCADDKFRSVLELEQLYQSAESYSEVIAALNKLAKSSTSVSERLSIQLGVLFMKRTRATDSVMALLRQLDSLSKEAHKVKGFETRINVVKLAIKLLRSSDLSDTHERLEQLYGQLKTTTDQLAFGLNAWYLGISFMWTTNPRRSEDAFQDALSVFRRFEHRVLYALVLADYGVLKKRRSQYGEATRLLRQALTQFRDLGLKRGAFAATNNLAVVSMRIGDWRAAELYFRSAKDLLGSLISFQNESLSYLGCVYWINYVHFLILKRDFDTAEEHLRGKPSMCDFEIEDSRLSILIDEFTGELATEIENTERAVRHLERAYASTKKSIPYGDVSTEVIRRLANALLLDGRIELSRDKSLECIRMCKTIGDEYELGAALRVLAESLANLGMERKARSCFQSSIRVLKNIQEPYELMKSCLAFGSLLNKRESSDAETYLMEARQLSQKLELDYFTSRIDVELSFMSMFNGSYSEASDRLRNAKSRIGGLHKIDRKRIEILVDDANKKLEKKVMIASALAAEDIKTLCRVYEEAKFPMSDLKSDLIYQVAQTLEAESLFLIKRKARGFIVPLAYNISKKDAKEAVRRLDRNRDLPLLGVYTSPKVHDTFTGRSLVCISAPGAQGYVLCACIKSNRELSARQFEYLIASTEVIERLAVDSVEGKISDLACDEFVPGDSIAAVTHPRGCFRDILTVTPDMIKVIRLAERASVTDETIVLEGETGVGKELFAHAIHKNSKRKEESFVAVNAGGLPVSLLESQLFGHIRGAFTDAVRDRSGLIEEAHGGTLFLDEVGEMGPELQVKLLRLLENREYRKLGENDLREANVRVISATNRDLTEEVKRGNFRRDLYYRLGTVKLQIPPLRFRKRDVELLTRHFLNQISSRYGHIGRLFEVDVKAMEALEMYDWPGNVRELQNEIRKIVSLIGDSNVIKFAMLSRHIQEYLRNRGRSDSLLELNVDRYERRLILNALDKNDWNRMRTAEELGLPRTTLLAKMRRLNVAAR